MQHITIFSVQTHRDSVGHIAYRITQKQPIDSLSYGLQASVSAIMVCYCRIYWLALAMRRRQLHSQQLEVGHDSRNDLAHIATSSSEILQ